MASGGDDSEKSSWWDWNNIVKAAKEKTLSTLEIVKSDFSEFTTVMSNDTTNLINSATAQFVEKSNTASYLLDTFDNKVKIETNNRLKTSSTVQERYENELKSIQLNENTYLLDPEQSDEYEKWKENFNSETNKSIISDLLIENSSMRLIYSKLVPAQISNDQFWCRYFFKTNLFEEEQKKRIKLLERVKDMNNEEETLNWEEDEDDDTINNSGQSNDESVKELPENKNLTTEEVISKEITDLLIKEQTADILNEISCNIDTDNDNEKIEDKNVKAKNEAMEASIKTEDSDDWDKVNDDSDMNESDSERKKNIRATIE